MDSIDLEVLKVCEQWLSARSKCLLVTVVKTWGSSPRPEGAMLAICADGAIVGSVSGGCIEDDLIERVRREGITQTRPEILTYGISADEAHRFGLPCGGTIQLALEPLSGDSEISALLARVSRQELVSRSLDLRTGKVVLTDGVAGQTLYMSETELITSHGPQWRLLLIGAGQLSSLVARIALSMDYKVLVCDPRQEHRSGWNMPEVEVLHEMPDDVVIDMQLDSHSAVLALTHDPKLDDLALMEALRSPAFYVGAIGSRINSARRRERLKQFDLSQSQVDRLHGPVGLYIGSKTPAEIAVSIVAEMAAVRNGVRLPDAVKASYRDLQAGACR